MSSHCDGDSNPTGSSLKIPEIKFTKLFINGEFVDSVSGKTLDTFDPRTGEVIAKISLGDAEDVNLAVKAARHAFDHGPWPRMSGFERGMIMMKFADLIQENAEEIAALDTVNGGKLFIFCKLIDITTASRTLRYYAGAADKIHGTVLKLSKGLQGYTLKEPIGVVGSIIPWNFPTAMFFMKTAPALAAGCTIILKPAEQTPLSALYYAHLAKLAGVPDGVLNVVNGYGCTTGAAISSHMDIDKVTFTGSTEVGRKIMMAAAASNLKPVSLELGGKSPMLIFDDADIDQAADIAFRGMFFNKGEICVASSRVFVQEDIYEKLEKKLVEKAKATVVGDPFDPKVHQGPQDDMTIAKEEIFGPVLCLMKFKTMEEAIERANITAYGLAAGIITKNLNVANTVSRSIRAGVIWINCYTVFDMDCPYGGYKMSGFGRDFGLEALDQYLQTKSVVTPVHNSPWY
ncbi:hypothetical protein V6N13_095214 [Hibiscus sabdariffa]|uniref:Aldehyde dehydrogenase domain-containing protein n=1 Tax=Hibiscus sabdariffa TaxID=183260 RepID=A0ABR2PSD5_9ROSI